MNRTKIKQQAVVVLVVLVSLIVLIGYKSNVYAASSTVTNVLKQGMQGDEVIRLQGKLKELNLFNTDVTGYYGDITRNSVISFQERNGLKVDGLAGIQTMNALFNQQQLVRATQVSRGDIDRNSILVPWFNGAEDILAVGNEAVVTDIDSGISFRVKRTGGYNHSDTETLSTADTALLKKIYVGQWSWVRRAVIVTVGNRKIAASITGMPHAGIDNQTSRTVVSNRSGGYGTGVNYDSIKGNGMDGHFDIHFLGSRTHGTNRVDEQHQAMVMKAANSYMK